jgi:flagellar assembly protein FliH
LSKGKIIKDAEISSFGMPSFDHNKNIEQLEEYTPDNEELERQAYEKGFQSGEKAGYEVGLQKAAVLVEKLQQLIDDFNKKKVEILNALEPQVVALSIAIARSILKDEISTSPERIVNLVKIAMRRIVQPGQIVIRINPALTEMIDKHKPELLQINGDVRIEEDPTVVLSAPVVSSSEQEIPVDIEAQLTNLIEELGERIGEHNP